MMEALKSPTLAIDSDGRGVSQPVASNETAQGRALNRRVEVEFWYDDPLQELSDELQICPGEVGEEMLTKVYDPPWGHPRRDRTRERPADHSSRLRAALHRALTDIADRTNARLRFIGYTKNERLDRRTASVYGDDIGLSSARARRAMESVMQDPQLAALSPSTRARLRSVRRRRERRLHPGREVLCARAGRV